MTYYVDVRPAVRRSGPPRLVPLGDLGKYQGFRSVFAFNADIAELIADQGSTANLRGVPVYADRILVDFDGRDSAPFRERLIAEGIGFEWYDTGNRSDHYQIQLAPVEAAWLPAAMKAWVKARGPTADLSFYHPAGMYRLPGTFHAKVPGASKRLVESYPGKDVVLEAKDAPTPIPMFYGGAEGSEVELLSLCTATKGPGHRSPHAWRIATAAAEAGKTMDEAMELLHWWNQDFCQPPQEEQLLQSQCEKAYRRVGKLKHG